MNTLETSPSSGYLDETFPEFYRDKKPESVKIRMSPFLTRKLDKKLTLKCFDSPSDKDFTANKNVLAAGTFYFLQ